VQMLVPDGAAADAESVRVGDALLGWSTPQARPGATRVSPLAWRARARADAAAG